jgi:hypothetical protein
MDIAVSLPDIVLNWNPIVMNRMIRLFRYMSYSELTVEKYLVMQKQTMKLRYENKGKVVIPDKIG